LNTIQLL